MAEKKITPKAPEKAEEQSTSKTAAARVSKNKHARKAAVVTSFKKGGR